MILNESWNFRPIRIKSFTRSASIYYIFKCGLHYLAMIKLVQRITFACLTKEFLHV